MGDDAQIGTSRVTVQPNKLSYRDKHVTASTAKSGVMAKTEQLDLPVEQVQSQATPSVSTSEEEGTEDERRKKESSDESNTEEEPLTTIKKEMKIAKKKKKKRR